MIDFRDEELQKEDLFHAMMKKDDKRASILVNELNMKSEKC